MASGHQKHQKLGQLGRRAEAEAPLQRHRPATTGLAAEDVGDSSGEEDLCEPGFDSQILRPKTGPKGLGEVSPDAQPQPASPRTRARNVQKEFGEVTDPEVPVSAEAGNAEQDHSAAEGTQNVFPIVEDAEKED